jgi:peptidyl-prolyl cis-trans isomerase SurA
MLIVHDSISFSYAVKRFGHKEAQSFNNDGRMVNPASGNTFFETGDLDPDIYFTVDTMKVGKISKPVEYTDPSGDIYYRIIQLQTRTPPHRASLAIDYSKIQKAAIESKRNETINKWVTEQIGRTFVSFDREISGCPSLDVWVNQKSPKPKP